MRRYPSFLFATLALVGAFAATPSARAADETTCSVRLVGDDGGAGYREAVAAEDARVAKLDQATNDCRLIEVHVTLDGAVVVFTTRDGRQAVRRIASPAELGSTVEALLVTTPVAPKTEPEEPPAPPPKAKPRVSSQAPSPPVDPENTTRVIALMDVGARLAAPGRFVTPTIALGAHMLVRRWEIGAEVAIEPLYGTSQATPAGFQMIGTVISVGAGRREPLGSGFELLAMGRATVALMHEEIEATSEAEETQGSRAELRLGAAGSLIYAREARFRMRATLSGDYIPKALSGGRLIDSSLPRLPSWGATLTIGAEADLL
jgi:hypothetical protein